MKSQAQYIIVVASILVGGLIAYLVGRAHRRFAERPVVERLQRAQRAAQIGDWEYFPDSDTLIWSDYLCLIYGRSKRESRLSDVLEYVGDAQAWSIRRELELVRETGKPRHYELRVKLGDGSLTWRRIIAVPQVDPNGFVASIFGTDQDISAERERDRLQAKLENAQRFDSLNALASTLAHELAQPLTAASTNASLLCQATRE